MKMITLWEPWASAIALGYKHYETRSWPAPKSLIGKPLGIHASKKKSEDLRWQLEALTDWFPEQFNHLCYDDLPFGCVVAACQLVACHPTEKMRGLSELEAALGDYSPGRFAWELELIKLPDKPIPVKGKQGIWEWDGT
jgi:hypothetical protein